MKLHEFTSQYTILRSQSPSDGTYWASIYQEDCKVLIDETDNYEDYEDAMAAAHHIVERLGKEDMAADGGKDEEDN